MKTVLVLMPFLALALAAPQGPPRSGGPESDAVILKLNNDNIGVDGYTFDFETSNGIARQEAGTLKNAGSENEAINVNGAFSNPVGDKKISVTFEADENGYRPKVVIS